MPMEEEFILWLKTNVPATDSAQPGIGDDAAVLASLRDGQAVLTSDLVADGVHFHLGVHPPDQIGRKALAVNLSDLAAMAAEPVCATVSLLLPRGQAADVARQIMIGIIRLANEFSTSIVGGDTNVWTGQLVISISALGHTTGPGPLLRRGAKPGDAVIVTGAFGGSLLGRHLRFQPRIAEARLLHQNYELHAAIDVSDGLTLDLSRLTEASGCGVELDLYAVPIHDDAYTLSCRFVDGQSPLDHALGDGEDFELLMAVPPDSALQMLVDQPLEVPLTQIGTLIDEPGLWRRTPGGGRVALAPMGFRHGSEP
jgi:thiamine-monophosphate kinase